MPSAENAPRVAIVSFREARPVPWMASIYSMERLLIEGWNPHVIHMRQQHDGPLRGLRAKRRLAPLLTRYGQGLWTLDPLPADGERWDLMILLTNCMLEGRPLSGVMELLSGRADTTLLLNQELWPPDLDEDHAQRSTVYNAADHVFIQGELAAQKAMGMFDPSVAIHQIHGYGDTQASPRPTLADRPVTVLNFGRRAPAQHQALRAWAERTGSWYQFDTIKGSSTDDALEHQRVFCNMLANSMLAICNYARFDQPHRLGASLEAGGRYYEAMAAGCAIAGDLPQGPTWEANFGHLPGIFEFPLEADEVPPAVEALRTNREQQRHISASMRAEALRHHDIAHRLDQMITTAGFESPAAVTDRIEAMAAEADELDRWR